MRLTPLRLAFLFVAALIILGPATALTQPPGRGGKDKGGFGQGGDKAPGDPNAGGSRQRGSIEITSIPTQFDPKAQEKAADWAAKNGITNGILTREQFGQYMQDAIAQRTGQGGGPTGRSPNGRGPGGPGGYQQPARDYDKEAENSFRRLDHMNNGQLEFDDMPAPLQEEWVRWDKNQDGFIDLAEYKEYYKARMKAREEENGGTGEKDQRNPNNRDGQNDQVPDDEKRPTVYRVGHLPKELPPWFEQLDVDRDGQVGLYEWKKSTMDIKLFMQIDTNSDGFLTVEEVLRWQKVQAALAKKKDPNAPVALDDEDDPDGTKLKPQNPAGTGNFGRTPGFGTGRPGMGGPGAAGPGGFNRGGDNGGFKMPGGGGDTGGRGKFGPGGGGATDPKDDTKRQPGRGRGGDKAP